jgi:hypothetical protein
MRSILALVLTGVGLGSCATGAWIGVQRALTPVPAADCLPRALESAPGVSAVGGPDSTGFQYPVRISDSALAQRHLDVFVGITTIRDSAATVYVRDQWFGTIDAYAPAERHERADAAIGLLQYITARCAPTSQSPIVCAEDGAGTHGGRPCQR